MLPWLPGLRCAGGVASGNIQIWEATRSALFTDLLLRSAARPAREGGGAVGAGARGFPQPHRQRCLAVLDRIEKGVQSRESEKRGRNSFGCGSCSYSHRNRQQHTLGNFRFRSQLGYTRSFSGNRWHFLNFIPRMEGARDYSKMSSEPTPAPKLTSRNIKDRVTRH